MPAIYFVRHGQTDWNAQRKLQGRIDVPINATGRDQARRNGGVLAELIGGAPFDFVSSPLLRTRQTMEIIRETIGLPKEAYRTDERLREISMGDWEGFTFPQIAESDGENYERREADIWNVGAPAGESYRELSARAVEWFSEVSRDTVAVSHGGVSRCVRAHLLGLTPAETMRLDVPQDKVLMIDGGKLNWL